jgi:hypothetical protein
VVVYSCKCYQCGTRGLNYSVDVFFMSGVILQRQKLHISLSLVDVNWLQNIRSSVLGESSHVRYYFSNTFLVCF